MAMDRSTRRGVIGALLTLLLAPTAGAQPGQVTVPRIEQMPNWPAPYEMRDWKAVARAYDAFVFDPAKTGEHLPVIWHQPAGPNYPDVGFFGLHTYVGTYSPANAEAINVLPALVGATLVGIDKRAGPDYVAMAQQFFNRRPEENVYLNGPAARSGVDWWYETMPNVFFYQLYDRYGPEVGAFAGQFRTVADRWLAAVQALGGGTTPWTVPAMNYRAFAFSTMQPAAEGVPEPEAAGAIAWLLYHAYVETGDDRYRIGAEQAMEFLNGQTTNPSYELQLAYGVYAAARMNAELGTAYDLERLVNWVFEVGPLRRWGTLVGTWGGYDVHGLVGEDGFHRDYAFVMNGFHQAAALVPMVRYDERFARAVGKWVLNLANASRLFYPGFLPAELQEDAAWSAVYDPDAVIAQEAMRESWLGKAPFATGDARDGHWARTNLSLYSSSSVGYLAAVVDTTDVPGLLRLDARATDFFSDDGYPTYLLYNPYDVPQTVTLPLPEGTHDLYESLTNQVVAVGVSGAAAVTVPGDAAVLLVVTPAGGVVTQDGPRRRVNGVVVDFAAGPGGNAPPRIKALAADRPVLGPDEVATLYCTAEDHDSEGLTIRWSASNGTLAGNGATARWTPDGAGEATVVCTVTDGEAVVADSVGVSVLTNRRPAVTAVHADPPEVDPGGTTSLTCVATDPDGDALTVGWAVTGGSLAGEGPAVTWTLPEAPGYYTAVCTATDAQGSAAADSVGVAAGRLVLHLPFAGDATDASGFGNDAVVEGATPTTDRRGRPGQAFAFDGVDDHLRVPMHPSLGFTGGLTVSLWLRTGQALAREAFIVSHGSWQNRWKLSLTPGQQLRWTVKTREATYDLDDPATVPVGAYTFVVATYDGAMMRLYRDGQLVAERTATGPLATTPLDLTLGQMMPGDARFNFSGVLDDVRVYSRALTPAEARALFDTAVPGEALPGLPVRTTLGRPYPNPFATSVTVPVDLAVAGGGRLAVYDLLGREVIRLLEGPAPAGTHRVVWDGRDPTGRLVAGGLYVLRLEADGLTLHRTVVLVR